MTIRDPHFIAGRLVWRFTKSGGEGIHCKPFIAFPDQVQEAVRVQGALHAHEIPAVLCYFSNEKWVLLTTERLLWRSEAAVATSVELVHVKDEMVEPHAMAQARNKLAWSVLTIVEDSGARHHIELESGKPFFGFLNALMAARKK
jgi:hypothetical protein